MYQVHIGTVVHGGTSIYPEVTVYKINLTEIYVNPFTKSYFLYDNQSHI